MTENEAPLMLGVSGCRGIVGRSLTPEVAVRYAATFGSWVSDITDGTGLVVLGRDGRAGGAMLHSAAKAGLLGTGCDVIDLDVATTPTVGVLVDEHQADAGMVLTASHNPQEWNGLKCLVRDADAFADADACAPDLNRATQIVDRFHSGVVRPVEAGDIGTLTSDFDAARTHIGRVTLHLEMLRSDPSRSIGTKVVLDSVNSSGRLIAEPFLWENGCRVTQLGGSDSGVFPHVPEPTRNNLQAMCSAVAASDAQVGFAQDPDADRLALIDECGNYIGEEYTLVLAALAVLSNTSPGDEEPVLVTNLSTSRMIDDLASRFGARVVRTPVGEANVVEAMKREGAILGGEGNGGVIWPQVTYVRDSLSAMALVLTLLADTGKTLGAIVADLPAYAIEKRTVPLARKEDAQPAIDAIARQWSGQRVDLQDGVRVDFEDGWLHVRPSNTEPIMRLIAEAPTAEAASKILDEGARVGVQR